MTVQSEHTTTARSFKHLSLSERGAIFALIHENRSIRYIAKRLKRTPSTVCREIRRGTTVQLRTGRIPYQGYFPETGQAVYAKHRVNSRKIGKHNRASNFLRFAETKILKTNGLRTLSSAIVETIPCGNRKPWSAPKRSITILTAAVLLYETSICI